MSLREIAVLAIFVVGIGCAHRTPNTYRLTRQGPAPILIPPGVARADIANADFVAEIRPGKGSCVFESSAIRLQPRKTKLRVAIDLPQLVKQTQPNWLRNWVLRAEEQGCIAPGESQKLAARILESVPLDSGFAFRLVNPNGIQTGYVELGPGSRIEVTSPILATGVVDVPTGEITAIRAAGTGLMVDLKGAADLIGFERAWYDVHPRTAGAGYRVDPFSAERNLQGTVERVAGPATNYFQFPANAAFFRLLYKIEANGVTALVMSGTSWPDLDHRTQRVGSDPAACEREQGLCVVLPRKLGINPYLVVQANGRELAVPVGATVEAALRQAGVTNPRDVLPRLTVQRLYRDKPGAVDFDRATTDILSLKLMGLEQLAW